MLFFYVAGSTVSLYGSGLVSPQTGEVGCWLCGGSKVIGDEGFFSAVVILWFVYDLCGLICGTLLTRCQHCMAVLLNLSEVLLLTDRLFGLMFNCVHSLENFH